jgi:hypothetical protein
MFKTILILFLLYCISARTVFLFKKDENGECVIKDTNIMIKENGTEFKCLNSIEEIIENIKDNDSIFISGEIFSIKELSKLFQFVTEKIIFENNEVNIKTASIEEFNKLQEYRFAHAEEAKKKPHLYTIYIRYNKIVE